MLQSYTHTHRHSHTHPHAHTHNHTHTHTHTHIYIYIYKVIVEENGFSESSSKSGRSCLCFNNTFEKGLYPSLLFQVLEKIVEQTRLYCLDKHKSKQSNIEFNLILAKPVTALMPNFTGPYSSIR